MQQEEKNLNDSGYKFIMSKNTEDELKSYFDKIKQEGTEICGIELRNALPKKNLNNLDFDTFKGIFINIKKPKIFAESLNAFGQNSSYNNTEFNILGKISCVFNNVSVYDTGEWDENQVKRTYDDNNPPKVHLSFTPGFLNTNTSPQLIKICDENNITDVNQISLQRNFPLYSHEYEKHIEESILPVLLNFNEEGEKLGKKVYVTLPGMGLGCFNKVFSNKKTLGELYYRSIQNVISKHQDKLNNIEGVGIFVFGDEIENKEDQTIGNTKFILRNHFHHGLFTFSKIYNEFGVNNNSNDVLFTRIVAADHISWPGNDYNAPSVSENIKDIVIQNRRTDEGSVGACTNIQGIMASNIPNISFKYYGNDHNFQFAKGYFNILKTTFSETVKNKGLKLQNKWEIYNLNTRERENSNQIELPSAIQNDNQSQGNSIIQPGNRSESLFKIVGTIAAVLTAIGIYAIRNVIKSLILKMISSKSQNMQILS
ncbi:hypothetical protein [Lyticum sinuosum]|nr:hypothetical protein [Lyticum sinuosum]